MQDEMPHVHIEHVTVSSLSFMLVHDYTPCIQLNIDV